MSKKSDAVYRFAPSPTGYLHVGGARTAIFNWLLARSNSGKFLIRIEDTDAERSTDEAVKQIISSLEWLGIRSDEKIVYQSQRLQRYQEVLHDLVISGNAYPCFCTPHDLSSKRETAKQLKHNYVYDGTCRDLTENEIKQKKSSGLSFSTRLKINGDETIYFDGVHGDVVTNNKEFGDYIIARSDGTPVYQLAVVVDDHDMGITDIVRGDDHISNTPKQILIYSALNWKIPQFCHLPLILGEDKKRLSKRHGASSVEEFKDFGILPDALFNYLCLLGWSPGDDREIMSKQDLTAMFNLDRVSKGNAVFDSQKLLWMNAIYIVNLDNEIIYKNIIGLFNKSDQIKIEADKDRFLKVIDLIKPRVKTLTDFLIESQFYTSDPETYEQKGVDKFFYKSGVFEQLNDLMNLISEAKNFTLDHLEQIIRNYAEKKEIGAGKVIHPLRLALTGKTTSPGIFEVIYVLGKETVERRIKNALEFIENNN
jgi:glutamyl-tRNA synthetase